MTISKWMISGAMALALMSSQAIAQQETTTDPVASSTDWLVFEDSNPRECWAVSVPKEQVNTRDGRVVDVTRGQTLLMVFERPANNISGQVAFTGGYPIASNQPVTLEIDSTAFTLLPDGDWAWPAPEDDARIVAAMKRGSNAIVTAISSRGTTTRDSFSLLGFTAAQSEAERRCN